MNARRYLFLLTAIALSASQAFAAAPGPDEFAWRASLDVPAGASLARAELPAAALARLQSANAHDVRVFNANGEPVPFAMLAPAAPTPSAEDRTRSYPALPLYSAPAGRAAPKGSVQLRVEGGANGQRSVWVQLDGAAPAGEQRLNAVLFGMKEERRPLAALDVQATLPANMPVRVAVSTSADLATWTSAPVRGRLYRFEGEGAPVNMRLEFGQPLTVEHRFVRLDWDAQPGVAIASITGVVATAAPAPRRVRVDLPALHEAAPDAAEVETGFATPMAALSLATPRDNTLMPVRVLGRNDASQPWRMLGQTVVYRLGAGADAVVNPPLDLHGASVRMLRVVAANGAALAGAQIHAAALFQPVQLVLVASGPAPFARAVGRDRTEAAALPLATIAGTLGERKPEDLPLAKTGESIETSPGGRSAFSWRGVPGKSAVLWAVLAAGVLLLAGVAWSLSRQMKEGRTP
jgi:hypothetical protein